MVGVGFHVHHVVVCQRLLLCFLTPIFCDSCGNWAGGKVPWRGCGLQGFACMCFPMGLWKTGVKSRWRSVIFLISLMDLSERLAVLGWVLYPQEGFDLTEKSSWWPLWWYPGMVWGGVPGERQSKLWGRWAAQTPYQDGLLRQWVVSIFCSIVAKTQRWLAIRLGWRMLCVIQHSPVLLLQCLTKVQLAASLPFHGGKWCNLS